MFGSMATISTVEVLEQCKVSSSSPPPQKTCNIPLTFFDLPWLFFPPNQPLFFYEYHHTTSHFLSTSLPTLKHSLSLTLHHFFPFSGLLTIPPQPTHKPYIACTQNDHVSLTVAESTADNFHHLTQYHNPVNVSEFHPPVPELRTTFSGCERQLPLLSIQVTVFPMSGLCLGFAYYHVVADCRTFNNFIKTWSSLCRDFNFVSLPIKTLPTFDRTVIVDQDGLEEVFLNEWFKKKCCEEEEDEEVGIGSETDAAAGLSSDMVRATFVVGPTHMNWIKKWIVTKCLE